MYNPPPTPPEAAVGAPRGLREQSSGPAPAAGVNGSVVVEKKEKYL